MFDQLNAGLLRVARQTRGWSQAELSRRSGVSQANLSKLENGLIGPTEEVMHRIASTLQYPMSFFFQSGRVVGLPISVHPMYRKRASVGQGAIEHLEAELNIRRLHLKKLLASTDFDPDLPLPKLDLDENGGDPERVAALVRRTWLMPTGPIGNLVEWIERAGCIVAHCDFSNSSVDGVTLQLPDMPPCIFLNRNQPADRQRFSLAHELGHIVMHRIPSPAMEEEANAFAAALLMPKGDIKTQFGNRLTLQRLAAMKPVWRVSMAALLYRAKTIGSISENQSSYLWRQMSSLRYRKCEPPELDFKAEQPGVLAEIFKIHLEDLGYSIEDLCEILHTTEDDLRKLHPIPGRITTPHLRVVS